MAILVTGGAGYIGSHMVLNLADAGETVVVLDNLVTGFDWAIDSRAIFVRGDAGDIALVGRLIEEHDISEIVHFAGSIVVPESVVDPLKYYANNTATSRNLIDAAVRGGIKHFIFSSTAAVYGMTGLEPVVETSPLNPMSPYGRSKLMTEWMLADVAAAHPMTFGVLRYFNVAGGDPGMRTGQSTPHASHLIKVACQTALGQRDHMDIFGTDFDTPDGTGVRDYIHVTDLIAAHALLLKHLRAGMESSTINCAYGQGYSVRQVIDAVREISGVPFRVNEAPRRAGDPASVTATGQKARMLLGWVPRLNDLYTIVDTAFAWERHLMLRNR
ncbi:MULTISPECIES: UDP-glucose 4-epimerase GalE [unclassified Devosia]|uniref:UDP-glucose 4-epimerase GalE n=1 Tax=unclassified Devosia TaxID=196773 RepID=UPI0025D2F9DB|nr:UDP-glucose 4-epimerase GalE [Devosia sp.]MCR6636560.1 UDP-glucose 4-epimerase GalE [Devosia sp.]